MALSSTPTYRLSSNQSVARKICFKTNEPSSHISCILATKSNRPNNETYSSPNNNSQQPTGSLRRPQTSNYLFAVLAVFTAIALLHYAGLCSTSRDPVRHNSVGSSIIADSPLMIPFQNALHEFTPMETGLETNRFNILQSAEPGLSSVLSSWNPHETSVRSILDAHLSRILVPRVSGTPGNILVRQYIMQELHSYGYHVEQDKFVDSTPIGNIEFANVVAYSNPKACRQLVLACHYDSKMQDGFLGATDSAVPCAMLLKLAATFRDSFSHDISTGSNNNLGLLFIFFDGEEAFDRWTATDSLYGSRHLAAKWEKQPAPNHCSGQKNELARIELFVLLDLIGTSDTKFVMYNRKLSSHYNAMQAYEKTYLTKNLRLSNDQARQHTAFKSTHIPLNLVEDDHVPFKKRGVPILSLLAHPFPKVWHTNDDNYESIDFERTVRILYVLEQFVSNYQN